MSINLFQDSTAQRIDIACQALNECIASGALCGVKTTLNVSRGKTEVHGGGRTVEGIPIDQVLVRIEILPPPDPGPGIRYE
jgi:hypothetical protein